MLISFRISSASNRDKLPLQPPDGNELKLIVGATSSYTWIYLPKVHKEEISFSTGNGYGNLESDLLIFEDKTKKKLTHVKNPNPNEVGRLRTCAFGLRRDWMSCVHVAPSIRLRYDDQHDREYLEDSFGQAVRSFEYLSCPKKNSKIFKNFHPRG